MRRIILIAVMAALTTGCVSNKKKIPDGPGTPVQTQSLSPAMMSQLALGKQMFQDGYYKRALQQLLPLAAEGSMEAQYAVGYMYYYGLGGPQDTESGYFWIKRSAEQNYQPAINALVIVEKDKRKNSKPTL